jgi:adenylosuccinate synthase
VGPLPTELKDEVGSKLQEKGNEFGTVTGRKRRCGWLDAVAVSYASRVNGVTGIALTKLDTLGGFNPIRICKAYRVDDQVMREQPASIAVYSKCEPIYEDMDGWPDLADNDWAEMAKKGYEALPKEMRKYIAKIEDITKVKVRIVSIGQARDATISRSDVWQAKRT